jgi:hypothetical protein
MDDKNYNDSNSNKNNTKNMEKEIRKILKQNKCNMACFIDDYDMDKGYMGIDLYFKPDGGISMGQLIDYLNNCLKVEYLDKPNKQYEEMPFKTFMQQQNNQCNCNKNNSDTEELIRTLVKENVDLWEKDYQNSIKYKLNIFKTIWNKIKSIFKRKDKNIK